MVQRHSPAVRYPLQRSRLLRWLWAWLALCSGTVLLAWFFSGAGYGQARWLRFGGAVLLWLLCTAGGWYALQRSPMGRLHWSGRAWTLEGAGPPLALQGAPLVVLDMQWLLVLTFRDVQQQPQHLVLQRDWAPQAWADVRRAVYSSAHPPQDASSRPGH